MGIAATALLKTADVSLLVSYDRSRRISWERTLMWRNRGDSWSDTHLKTAWVLLGCRRWSRISRMHDEEGRYFALL